MRPRNFFGHEGLQGTDASSVVAMMRLMSPCVVLGVTYIPMERQLTVDSYTLYNQINVLLVL